MKKILSMVLTLSIVLGTIGIPVFAEEVTASAKIGDESYATLSDALLAASSVSDEVVVEIYDKVTLNESLSGNYTSIKFVGKDTDAEIYLDVQGYITAPGKTVAFEGLKLSKSEGGFVTNAGFMNLAFGVYDVNSVSYKNCDFLNGACASSGEVTFTGCTFYRSHDRYGLWAYGAVDCTVDGCTFADFRGIKMYAEGLEKTVELTVKNTDFSAVNNKPAIVLTCGESVTLENNTYSNTGVFELDLDGAPNGTPVQSDVAPTCVNDNGACGVLVDGKIYATVAQAAEVATSGSTVTLLHNSAETVELPEGVKLDKNGFESAGVTVKGGAGLSGSGTEEDPYLINNLEDLKWFRDDVNAGNNYDGMIVKLADDIDLNSEEWTPIGNGTNKFLGTFDGANYTISNLNVDVDTNNAGLFGFASVIKNVTLNNATVSGIVSVGSLVGELESSVGTLDNCHVTGTIEITGENSIGGLAGKGYANIKNCSVDGTSAETSFVLGVYGNNEEGDNVGGIIGHLGEGNTLGVADSTVKNITVKGTRKIGGIVGTTARGNDYTDNTVENLIIESTATAEYANANASTTTIGGIVGNYFGSATSGGILKNSVVKNVTFNIGNAKSAGALAGGDRVNNGGEPVGIEATGNTVQNVTGATVKYLELIIVAKIGDTEYSELAEAMKAAKGGETVELVSDVDLAGTEWEPVSFAGKFNGNGYAIKNLTINKPGVSNVGFITSLNSVFENVTFENPTVTGGENTAVLAGRAGGSAAIAKDIKVTGTIKVETTHSGYARAAVIVGGWAYGNYENITVDGTDKAQSYVKHTGGGDGRYVAGIVGHADEVASYKNCTVKNITISGGWLCGAIAGPGPSNGLASGCLVENVDMAADYSGGMFGWYYGDGTIRNSTIRNVTFTNGSTNNGAIGGYSNNTKATVTNVTIENVKNADGKPLLSDVATVTSAEGVVEVYSSLQSAIDAANDGDTIELLADCVIDSAEVSLNGVNIDGDGKKLTINENCVLKFANANMTDVNVEGKGTVEFDGDINFYGTNNVTSLIDGVFDLVVNKGATLLITRFVLGYDRSITVYGEIEDAHDFDPTGMTPSLKFNSTSGVSVGGTGSGNLTVNDAYVELGNSSWKNACGTYDWNFKNSYVSATSFTNNNAGANDTAEWTVTFDDSVLAAKNYIKNGVGTTYNFTNGTVATTGSLRIDGVMNIDATSSVTTTAQQNNKVGAIDEHGGINGTVNVDGTLTIGSGNNNTALELLGGELKIGAAGNVNLKGNPLTLDADSKLVIDATGMTVGDYKGITGNVINNGTIEVINNNEVTAEVKDNKIVLVECQTVAKIGDTVYETLQAAINAVEQGQTITLLNDVTVTSPAYGENALNYAKAVDCTIDLGGFTVSADTGNSVFRFNIANSGATENVEVTLKNGKVVSGSNTWCALMASGIDADKKMILNLENVTVENSKAGDMAVKSWANGLINAKNVNINTTSAAGGFYAVGGEIVLNDCSVVQKGLHTSPYMSMAIGVSNNGKLTVNSGDYSSEPQSAEEGYNQGTSHGSWVAGVMNSGGTLIINDGTFANGNYGDDSLATAARGLILRDTHGVVEINGGTFNALGKIIDYQNNLDDATGNEIVTIKGGTFNAHPLANTYEQYVKIPEGYAAIENLSGKYVVGVAPTATVIDHGPTVIPADEHSVYDFATGKYNSKGTEDMPLNFVVQFIADESAQAGAVSPYADWYADFVLTFDGLEDGSFNTEGCYLAGYYGDFGWVKIDISKAVPTVEKGVHYPVMLGVGLGQKYDYICSGVKDFKCAMYLTPEVLEANPNLKVNLDLVMVDNSQGQNKAYRTLVDGTGYLVVNNEYEAEDFVAKKELFEITLASVTFGNNLDMSFAIPKNSLADWTGHYVEIVKEYADGRDNVIKTVSYEELQENGNFYVVTFNGIAAKEMTDNLYVTVYDTDGNPVSKTREDSIRAYADRVYASQSDPLKTIIADMLNYGAAAQDYFNDYNISKLANADFDTEFMTKEDPTVVNSLNASNDNFVGSSIVLSSNIDYRMAFKKSMGDITKATIEFTNHYDKPVSYELTKDNIIEEGDFYIVIIDKVVVADARQLITVKLYNGDTELVSVVDSIESYAKRMQDRNDLFAPTIMEFMKFADAADAYFDSLN